MRNKRRRFIKLIPDKKKRNLQMKYANLFVVSHFVLAILIIGLVYCETMLLDRYYYCSRNSMDLSLQPAQWGIIIGFILIVFGYIAILSILIVNFSHRLIGPLCRIESIIKEAIATGKISTIKLRKHDELQDTVDLLNRFFEDSRFQASDGPPLKSPQDV